MIYKNAQYWNNEGVTLVKFGHGTLRVGKSNTIFKKVKAIYMKSDKELKPLGSPGTATSGPSEFAPEVVLQFENEQSFAVLEHYVKLIRAEYDHEKLRAQ